MFTKLITARKEWKVLAKKVTLFLLTAVAALTVLAASDVAGDLGSQGYGYNKKSVHLQSFVKRSQICFMQCT